MENTSKMLIALGIGLVVGGVVGVLFAPEKGTVTRHKITDTGKKLAEKIKHPLQTAKEKIEEKLARVNGEVEEFA